MMLCDTKVSSPPSKACVRLGGFHHYDCLPSFGLAGGMWIFWKDFPSNPFLFNIEAKFDKCYQ